MSLAVRQAISQGQPINLLCLAVTFQELRELWIQDSFSFDYLLHPGFNKRTIPRIKYQWFIRFLSFLIILESKVICFSSNLWKGNQECNRNNSGDAIMLEVESWTGSAIGFEEIRKEKESNRYKSKPAEINKRNENKSWNPKDNKIHIRRK